MQKYIVVGELAAPPDPGEPEIVAQGDLKDGDALPALVADLLARSSTSYLATRHLDASYPRVGINHRGNRPGAVRVSGRTLYLPGPSTSRKAS